LDTSLPGTLSQLAVGVLGHPSSPSVLFAFPAWGAGGRQVPRVAPRVGYVAPPWNGSREHGHLGYQPHCAVRDLGGLK